MVVMCFIILMILVGVLGCLLVYSLFCAWLACWFAALGFILTCYVWALVLRLGVVALCCLFWGCYVVDLISCVWMLRGGLRFDCGWLIVLLCTFLLYITLAGFFVLLTCDCCGFVVLGVFMIIVCCTLWWFS